MPYLRHYSDFGQILNKNYGKRLLLNSAGKFFSKEINPQIIDSFDKWFEACLIFRVVGI